MDVQSQAVTTYHMTVEFFSIEEARAVVEDPGEFLTALKREIRLCAGGLPADKGDAHTTGKRNGRPKRGRPAKRAGNGKSGSFKCPSCPRTFSKQAWLSKHVDAAHGPLAVADTAPAAE